MTKRQMEDLILELYLALDLPEPPVFTPVERSKATLSSQVYKQTSGFMAKFVESYRITLSPHPEPTPDPDAPVGTDNAPLFSAGVTVDVTYQHGKWEQAGSNGVSTHLFFSRELGYWVDQNTAREMIHAKQGA